MKINLINLIDISLVLTLSYIIIFRGEMSPICFKAFIVGIISYYFVSKYYKVESYYLNVNIPQKYALIGKLINGNVNKNKSTKKIKKKKLEKFNSKISIRMPSILSESYSDF